MFVSFNKFNSSSLIDGYTANKNLSIDAKKRIFQENQKTDPFGKDKRGAQPAFTEQDASSLAKFAGVNLKDVAAKFKDKGGFEGLMANPAFTLGLALMQSSAQGKTIGSGVLDNFVKAAGLSDHYKDKEFYKKKFVCFELF